MRGAIQPEFDRLLDACRRLKGHGDLAAFACRGVTSVERFHYHKAVFAGRLRGFFAASATGEVGQLLRGAVVPEFLEDRVGPTLCGRGFFYRVPVAVFTVGG